MRFVLLFAGAALFLNGAFMALVSNFNLGVVLTVLVGLFFLLWGAFYKKVKEKVPRGIRYAAAALIFVEALLVGFLAVYGQTDNVTYKEDAVIVLGAGVHGEVPSYPLALRLRAAKSYYDKNPDAVFIVSGGKGFQENISEAEAMEKYLIGLGVPEKKIIKEDKSHSTAENMAFSKDILDKMFGEEYSVAVVTNNFHIYRAAETAKRAGLKNAAHLHAGLRWYNLAPCYLRESLAVIKLWISRA